MIKSSTAGYWPGRESLSLASTAIDRDCLCTKGDCVRLSATCSTRLIVSDKGH